jgi:hypothetical protein
MRNMPAMIIMTCQKALSILNHVRDFMRALEKGGLSE